ncbi:hypothetical protein AOLI_G00299090 [Acnodon oligacanthus]
MIAASQQPVKVKPASCCVLKQWTLGDVVRGFCTGLQIHILRFLYGIRAALYIQDFHMYPPSTVLSPFVFRVKLGCPVSEGPPRWTATSDRG